MSLRLQATVERGDFRLELDLSLPGEGVSALFGPSGSGKTTALRVLAGLERHPGVRVVVNGEVWQDGHRFLPPHRRALGYVFQEASLFPHLSVQGNLDYGFRRAGRPTTVDRAQLIDLLGIGALLGRRPDTLSGGERQRVAIARALFTAPRLLLLDEPLSALDTARKAELLPYLERLHGALKIPTVYVSHALEEVLRLADHLVLLDRGQVRAAGPLAEVLHRLDLPEGLGLEPSFVLTATVEALEPDGVTRLCFGQGGTLLLTGHLGAPGTRLRLRGYARDLSLSLEPEATSSLLNRLPATVEACHPDPARGRCQVALRCFGEGLVAEISERSRLRLGIRPGLALWVQMKGLSRL